MQKIHQKTIIVIETGAVVYDDAYLWAGLIAEAGKAPKMKMAQPPPPSAEEIEQRQLSNMISKLSLNQMGYDTVTGALSEEEKAPLYAEWNKLNAAGENQARQDELSGQIHGTGGTRLKKRALTPEEQQQADLEKKMMDRFSEELNRRPGEVSPEQEKALNELYGSEQSKMDEELQRFAVEQAGSRGLSMGDTPYARELLRAKSAGQTELGAARASSKLNFAEKERLFNQGLAQWKGDLQQQRLANLMGLGGQSSNTAIGFMNARANLKPTPYGGGGGGSQMGSIIGGVGSAVGGIAMAM